MQRRSLLMLPLAASLPARAHHGWSSFDTDRPLYLEGQASQVAWRNPHVALQLTLPEGGLKLPADLASRRLPAQAAGVDGPALLKAAQLPRRTDRRWQVELAPLPRMQAWGVPEIRVGEALALLGFTFKGEQGEAVLRAEYLFLGGKVYGLRSSPA